MLAEEVMHTKILTGKPETTVQELVKIMLDYNVSMVPIVDEGNKLLGVVTEGDIIYRAYSDIDNMDVGVALLGKLRDMMKKLEKHSGNTAKEIMTAEGLLTVERNSPLAHIAKLMVEKKVKNIPIVEKGILIGLVSRKDIMRMVAEGKIY